MTLPLKAELNPVYYQDVRNQIQDGDVLLYRSGFRPSSLAISRLGRNKTPYCHAALAAWWKNRLFVLETVQFIGGRVTALSQQVKNHVCRWDVYRPCPEYKYEGDRAVRFMIDMVGTRYGWKALGKAALTHLPLLRKFYPVLERDSNGDREFPFCSMAISRAMRYAALDPVPLVSDNYTEPGDLAIAPIMQYKFTLDWRF